MTKFSPTLNLIGEFRFSSTSVPCVVLAHNELEMVKDLVSYYRAFGNVSFLFVDDRSDDGSTEWLLSQPDVTVFRPVAGSSYAKDKRKWRSELLDHFASGKWALVPDADERLIYRDFETRPFTAFLSDLDAEGAEAVFCTMVDLYRDGPLSAQVIDSDSPISQQFRFFDDPRKAPGTYRFLAAPSRFLRNWPTPPMMITGGPRDRLFFSGTRPRSKLQSFLWSKTPLLRSVQPTGIGRVREAILRRLLKTRKTRVPELNLTKLPLLKWKRGSAFYGGAHAVSQHYQLSKETAVLLHYPITKGTQGVQYVVDRRQHAEQSGYYREILDKSDPKSGEIMFHCDASSEFTSSTDLEMFFGARL